MGIYLSNCEHDAFNYIRLLKILHVLWTNHVIYQTKVRFQSVKYVFNVELTIFTIITVQYLITNNKPY